MTKSVLLLGRKGIDLEEMGKALAVEGVNLYGGTNLDDVRDVFSMQPIDIVIMGAGIDLGDRLEIVRYVYETSDSTTVHTKERSSGPQGMTPFVGGVLAGLLGGSNP